MIHKDGNTISYNAEPGYLVKKGHKEFVIGPEKKMEMVSGFTG